MSGPRTEVSAKDLARVGAATMDQFLSGELSLTEWEGMTALSATDRRRVLYLKKTPGTIPEGRFEHIRDFPFHAPASMKWTTLLNDFQRDCRGNGFVEVDQDITDENFGATSDNVSPDENLTVSLFRIREHLPLIDAFRFLRDEKAVQLGAKGAALLCMYSKVSFQSSLPKGIPHPVSGFSVDDPNLLLIGRTGGFEHRLIPEWRINGNSFTLGLYSNTNMLLADSFLVCFRRVPEPKAKPIPE